jgi:RNA polymerase sigma-32 factor
VDAEIPAESSDLAAEGDDDALELVAAPPLMAPLGEEALAELIDVDGAEVVGTSEVPIDDDAVGLDALLTEGAPATAAPGLVRHDPLTAYVQEIRRYPLLSREDEHRLAVHYVETGDVAAARRLITANLRLVVKIAHEYRRAYRSLLDLVQEGNVGLVQAVRKYDPYRGVKLSSYAAWWIRAYIIKFILNNWRLVKIGTTQAQRKLFFNLKKERDKLERMGFEVGPKLLAERLEVTEKEVDEMERRLSGPDVSLDAPLSREDEDGATHVDSVEEPTATRPDRQAERGELQALLRAALDRFALTLAGRERTLFEERLLADPPLTLQEIGDEYGISRERARQIESRLLARLKEFLRGELGDAVDIAPDSDE